MICEILLVHFVALLGALRAVSCRSSGALRLVEANPSFRTRCVQRQDEDRRDIVIPSHSIEILCDTGPLSIQRICFLAINLARCPAVHMQLVLHLGDDGPTQAKWVWQCAFFCSGGRILLGYLQLRRALMIPASGCCASDRSTKLENVQKLKFRTCARFFTRLHYIFGRFL